MSGFAATLPDYQKVRFPIKFQHEAFRFLQVEIISFVVTAHLISERRSVPPDQRDAASNASHSTADRLPDRSIGGDEDDKRSLSMSSLDWCAASDDADINERIPWTERVYKNDKDVTLQELQRFANTNPDSAEEARADEVIKKSVLRAQRSTRRLFIALQEKSREVFSRFRGKTVDDYVAMMRRPRRDADGESHAVVQRLLGEHLEYLEMAEYMRNGFISSIDQLKLPKYSVQ